MRGRLRQSVPCCIALMCGSFSFAQPGDPRLDDSSQHSTAVFLADARRALAEDRPGAARVILDPWIKANERSGDPNLPEAILLRGDALSALGDEYNALYDYERVIRDVAASPHFSTAVERELNIGVDYLNGVRPDTHNFGGELLIRVQERMPGSHLAERAGIELADYYYRTRQLDLAAQAYELFVQLYPRSLDLPRAQRRLSMIARDNSGRGFDMSLWRILFPVSCLLALRRPRRS